MKIGKYDVTWGNIQAFITGNVRYIINTLGVEFIALPTHIQEQVLFREKVADNTCKSSGYCYCNCSVPELFYADKECDKGCYPPMQDEAEWERTKLILDNLDIQHPIIKFWKMDGNHRLKPYNSDLGDISTITSKTIRLSAEEDVHITDIKTSCGCTSTSVLADDEEMLLTVTIDPAKKRPNTSFVIVVSIEWSDRLITTIVFNGYNKITL